MHCLLNTVLLIFFFQRHHFMYIFFPSLLLSYFTVLTVLFTYLLRCHLSVGQTQQLQLRYTTCQFRQEMQWLVILGQSLTACKSFDH